MKVVYILLLFSAIVSAQSDWQRWEKKDPDYLIHQSSKFDSVQQSNTVIDYTQSFYQYFISDLDGDNCAFHPSCSHFFVEGVKQTNLFKGTLMFADRFTRDLNLFKGLSGYPYHYNGKFYDPSCNYLLDFSKIRFLESYQE